MITICSIAVYTVMCILLGVCIAWWCIKKGLQVSENIRSQMPIEGYTDLEQEHTD